MNDGHDLEGYSAHIAAGDAGTVGDLAGLSRAIAWSVVDMTMIDGSSAAIRLLQACLGVDQDGIVGPKTVQAASSRAQDELITAYADARQRYYKIAAEKNPDKAKRLSDWLTSTVRARACSLEMLLSQPRRITLKPKPAAMPRYHEENSMLGNLFERVAGERVAGAVGAAALLFNTDVGGFLQGFVSNLFKNGQFSIENALTIGAVGLLAWLGVRNPDAAALVRLSKRAIKQRKPIGDLISDETDRRAGLKRIMETAEWLDLRKERRAKAKRAVEG